MTARCSDTIRTCFWLLLVLSGSAGSAGAQDLPLATHYEVPGLDAYDPSVPRPEQVIGHRAAERHTRPDEIVRYFEAVADASDRVELHEHGRTHEGRPLIHAIVASPENLGRLEEIRLANLKLFEDPSGVSTGDLASMPGVVYLAYSVHGNEASGAEASLLALYHLAAGRGAAVGPVLDDLVVIIDPMLNPDGRARFVDWVNENRGTTPSTDPQDREHDEPWPGGRTNHYWFDLNRDWLPATQPESRARLRLFARWRPQLLCDFHEMGGESTFFFQPGVPERTNPNTPAQNQELTARIAQHHARAFDRIGQPYFSGERFDDFYYGKGSTYPDLNGAVGILFEQASSRASAVETSRGVLRYPHTVRNQFVATLSSLEAAAALRLDLLRHQRDFYGGVSDWARSKGHTGWLIERGTERADSLAGLLALHGIRVFENDRAVEIDGRDVETGGAWVAPLRQPQGRLLDSVMERVTEYRDSVFYDVSAWTVPLAFDVPSRPANGSVEAALGAPFPGSESAGGAVATVAPSTVGWLLPWGDLRSARALARWLDAGLEARVLTRPITVPVGATEADFGAGMVLLAPRRGRTLVGQEALELLQRLATDERIDPVGLSSGLSPLGPDFGGPSASLVSAPDIGLLVGPGVSSNRSGEVWFEISHRLRLPVSLLDANRVESLDLDRYEVIILAGGSVSDTAGSELRSWAESGGTLVVLGSAASWAVREGLLSLEARPFDVDSLTAGTPWAELGSARSAHFVSGAILEANLDATHPLAFGIGDRLPMFVASGSAFVPATAPGATVATWAAAPRLSGWLSAARESSLQGAAAVSVERHGRGRVIGIHAYPVFRGFWLGSARLLWNAVLFGPTL